MGSGGAGMSQVLIALMPVVLGMLANRRSQGASPTQMNYAPGGGGGLADVLGQVLGGAGGGRGAAGGLGGLLGQLQQAGFGEQADSWVSRRSQQANLAGRDDADLRTRWARADLEAGGGQSGRSVARPLPAAPEVVDHMTPDGDVPDDGALANSVDQFARRPAWGEPADGAARWQHCRPGVRLSLTARSRPRLETSRVDGLR